MTSAQNNGLFTAGALGIICISLALDIYGHSCGLLLTPDSHHYLAAAKSFRTDQIFLNQQGGQYVHWPPLFPMVLSLFSNPVAAMLWVNFFIKVMVSFLLFSISKEYIRHSGLRLSFLLVTLCGVHLLMISTYLWSELIFLVLLLINFYAVLHYRASRIYVIVLLVSGFLICLQRNAGFFYVSAVTLWLFVQGHPSLKSRLIVGTIFFTTAVSGLSLWHVYVTHMQTGYWLGSYPFFEDVSGNLFLILLSLGKLFMTGTIGVIVAIILVIASVIYVLQAKLLKGPILLVFLIVVTYIPGLAFVEALRSDEMDRFLAVIIPFLCLLIYAAADQLFKHKRAGWRATALVILICWNTYSLTRAFFNVKQWHTGSCSELSQEEHPVGS